MKWLVITEKPSVALDISKALKGFEKEKDFYENENYVITWAVGHLVELLSPEDLDPKYKRWLLQDLPILPGTFQYKPKSGQKERLENIRRLAKRKDIQGYINGCDAGREGELIFREIYEYCQLPKPMKRLWLQSMTTQAIKDEFGKLQEGKVFDPLHDAARCRAESDWLIGMNGTRALTKRLKPKRQNSASSWSVGRVQTPTLTLLVNREREVLKHRPVVYWTLEGRFEATDHSYSGFWFDPQFKESVDPEGLLDHEKADRIFNKEKKDLLYKELTQYKKPCKVEETRKESKEIAPQLFDLTSLQRESNRRFGISASRTLQAAQRLYEKNKLITYPRTDSKYLPEDYVEKAIEILKNIPDYQKEYKPFTKDILKQKTLPNFSRIFDNKKISDHFAIIPTGEMPKASLEGDDARIYDLILKRFLAAFMPQSVWHKVERLTYVGLQVFRTRVQDLSTPGWRAVYGSDGMEESQLPALSGATVECQSIELHEDKTKALPRITEAKLLTLMETCGRSVSDESLADALKDKGIGTPATRAEIIENLIGKEYVTRIGKALKPSTKGMQLVDILNRIPIDSLSKVDLSGEMEFNLKNMEKGQYTRSDFMEKIVQFTEDIVEKARNFQYEEIFAKEDPLGQCPSCQVGHIMENFWSYKCQNTECEFLIWKEKSHKYLDRSFIKDLLSKPIIGPFEFYYPNGQSFETYATVLPKGLVFCDATGQPTESLADEKSLEVIYEENLEMTHLQVPGRLYENGIAYFCEMPKKTGKPIVSRMPKTLCSRVITRDEFRSFVTTGQTPPITDFTSKKGKPFSAALHMKANGSFEFKFQSRKKVLPEGETPKPKKPRAPSKRSAKVEKR